MGEQRTTTQQRVYPFAPVWRPRHSSVEKVCKACASDVDTGRNKIFSRAESPVERSFIPLCIGLRTFLRFRQSSALARIATPPVGAQTAIVTVQHYDQTINGQTYRIEAMLVDPERWRAYLVLGPGGPTALMPFYGATAELAVEQLTAWLTLAHGHPV